MELLQFLEQGGLLAGEVFRQGGQKARNLLPAGIVDEKLAQPSAVFFQQR